MARILSFTTLANSYADKQMPTLQNLAPENRVYAHRRLVYNHLVDWHKITTVATVALLALGFFASLKVFLLLGIASLLMRHSVDKNINGLGGTPAGMHVPHLFHPNNPARIAVLRAYMGLPAQPPLETDAYAAFDVSLWKNKVPMGGFAAPNQGELVGAILGIPQNNPNQNEIMDGLRGILGVFGVAGNAMQQALPEPVAPHVEGEVLLLQG